MAEPPSRVTKSRRLMGRPQRGSHPTTTSYEQPRCASQQIRRAMSQLGPKPEVTVGVGHVRSAPASGHQSHARSCPLRGPTADVPSRTYVPILLQKSKIELLRKSRVSWFSDSATSGKHCSADTRARGRFSEKQCDPTSPRARRISGPESFRS